MSRALQKFGYLERLDTAPELTSDFSDKISEVIDAEPTVAMSFLAELRVVLHRYQLRKEARTCLASGRPTEGQRKANARIIQKNVSALIEQLTGEAGGLKHYINNGITHHYSGNENYPSTQKLIRYLQGVEFGCKDFLNEVNQELGELRFVEKDSADDMKPMEYLTREIAILIRDILEEKPTSYIYEGLNRTNQIDGKFARILKLCLEEFEPGTDRELRTRMRTALKNL